MTQTYPSHTTRPLIASLVFLVIYALIFVYKRFFSEALYQDEIHFLQTAIQFSKEPIPSLKLLETYGELNTPLPFILGGWIIRLFGEDIFYLRMLNFVLSYGILLLFIWTPPRPTARLWVSLIGIFLFPSYYLCSIYYYTDIIAMICVLLGFVYYLRNSHVVASLFFIAAVCSRQYMLAFPAAILMHLAWQSYRQNGWGFIAVFFKQTPWLAYLLAVLSLVPWVLLWKGAAPAAEMARQYYETGKIYNLGFVLYASSCISVYFVIPEALMTRRWGHYLAYPRKNPLLFIGLVIVVLVIAVFFPAQQTNNKYFDWPYLGYVDQGLTLVGLSGLVKQLLYAALMLLLLMRFITPELSLGSWVLLINLLMLGKAQLSWDKYSLPTVLILWYLTLFNAYWPLQKKTED